MPSQESARRGKGSRDAVLNMKEFWVPVPNFFFDKVMPRVSGNQFKVLLFLWRKTVGFDRSEDWISLSQIEQGTGLCSDTVIELVTFWLKVGLMRRLERRGIRGVMGYTPNVYYSPDGVLAHLEALVGKSDRSKSSASTGRILPTSPVEPVETQREINEEKSGRESPAPPTRKEERVLKNLEKREAASRLKQLINARNLCTNRKERERLDEEIERLRATPSP